MATQYSYDVGNRLAQVSTSFDAGMDTITQTRTFVYDHRGFLTSETHPEKDGAVTYPSHDGGGHVLRRVDGANDLTFEYDRAERLYQVHETGGLKRTLKEWQYATTNVGGDWRKGKVRKARRYNYVDLQPLSTEIFHDDFECGDLRAWSVVEGGVGVRDVLGPCDTSAYDVLVEETFSYARVGGRVSRLETLIQLGGATVENFTQRWTYHPNNLVHAITHQNGVVVTQANDPNDMASPARIEASVGGVARWSTGDYS